MKRDKNEGLYVVNKKFSNRRSNAVLKKKNMHINIKQTTTAYKKHHQALAYQQIPIGVQKRFKLQSRTKLLEKLQNE